MGVVANISYEDYPVQSDWVGKHVRVCFNYDMTKEVIGTVIRDDTEAPGELIFQLEDGRIIRSVECQHSLPIESVRIPKYPGKA